MNMLSTAIIGLGIVLSAQVAQAYVVQVVTAVPMRTATSLGDTSQLDDDVMSAIRDVVHHAIAFTPTFLRIQDARIIGQYLYLVLLVADADGEAIIERLGTDKTSPSRPEAPDDDQTDETLIPEPTRP